MRWHYLWPKIRKKKRLLTTWQLRSYLRIVWSKWQTCMKKEQVTAKWEIFASAKFSKIGPLILSLFLSFKKKCLMLLVSLRYYLTLSISKLTEFSNPCFWNKRENINIANWTQLTGGTWWIIDCTTKICKTKLCGVRICYWF